MNHYSLFLYFVLHLSSPQDLTSFEFTIEIPDHLYKKIKYLELQGLFINYYVNEVSNRLIVNDFSRFQDQIVFIKKNVSKDIFHQKEVIVSLVCVDPSKKQDVGKNSSSFHPCKYVLTKEIGPSKYFISDDELVIDDEIFEDLIKEIIIVVLTKDIKPNFIVRSLLKYNFDELENVENNLTFQDIILYVYKFYFIILNSTSKESLILNQFKKISGNFNLLKTDFSQEDLIYLLIKYIYECCGEKWPHPSSLKRGKLLMKNMID